MPDQGFAHPYAEMVAVLESAKAADVQRFEVTVEQVDRWASALVKYEPPAYPACGHCGTPFELRQAYSLTGGMTWAWFRGCSKGSMKACKAADPVTRGPLADRPGSDG